MAKENMEPAEMRFVTRRPDPGRGQVLIQIAASLSDLTPKIAARAYKQEGHPEGHAVKDWDQAGREIQNEEIHP